VVVVGAAVVVVGAIVVVVGAAVVVVGAIVVVVGAAVVVVGATVVVVALVVVVGCGFLAFGLLLVRTTRIAWHRAEPAGAGPQTGRCSTLWPRWSGGGGPCGSAPANVAWPRPMIRAATTEMTTRSAERRARMKELQGEEGGAASLIVDDDSDHYKGRFRTIRTGCYWSSRCGVKENASGALRQLRRHGPGPRP